MPHSKDNRAGASASSWTSAGHGDPALSAPSCRSLIAMNCALASSARCSASSDGSLKSSQHGPPTCLHMWKLTPNTALASAFRCLRPSYSALIFWLVAKRAFLSNTRRVARLCDRNLGSTASFSSTPALDTNQQGALSFSGFAQAISLSHRRPLNGPRSPLRLYSENFRSSSIQARGLALQPEHLKGFGSLFYAGTPAVS